MRRGDAARATVQALRDLGRLEPVDTALAQHLITIGDELDMLPEDSLLVTAMQTRFLQAEQALHKRVSQQETDVPDRLTIDDVLSAPLGDEAD